MPASRGAAPPVVECPTCARKVEFSPANRWRPFCSQRCREIDLGAWASGDYVVPGAPLDASSDELDSPQAEDGRR